MMRLRASAVLLTLALSACSSRNLPSISTNPGDTHLSPPGVGGAPQHRHIVNPPVLAANLNVPASALMSSAGMQKIATGVAVRIQGVIIDVSLTTYGKFLASVNRKHRSGYVDSDRQVYRVTYGLTNGLTTGGGVIASGGQQISVYDALDGRYLGSTYRGTYIRAFSVSRQVR